MVLVVNKSSDKSNGKLKVVTTNSILYDMAKNVGGTTSIFIVLLPVGQDPHEYEVKPKDIKVTLTLTLFYTTDWFKEDW